MLIEIKGVQFVNKGAELMLSAILDKLSIELPEAEICLAHNKNTPYLKRAKVGAYQKIELRKNIIDLNRLFYFCPRVLRTYFKTRFGIVSEADVDVILDASGFGYGDQWSDVILQQVASVVKRVKQQKKHYIFLPQSLGPFSRSKNQKYASKAFSHASLVFARETPSYNHACDLVVKNEHIHQAPDFTNLLEPALSADYSQYQDHIILVPNSKMLSSKNQDQWWRDNYVLTLISLANNAIALGEKVVILNHSGAEDATLCAEIASHLMVKTEIVEPPNAIRVKALIGRGKLVISSRFHGCVSALSQSIPCIATGWSHKYQELFSEYDMADLLLPSQIAPDELEQLLENCLQQLEYKKRGLEKNAKAFKLQSEQMWQTVFAMIKQP
ncbi:polysaccharide pyruvyl transferase family protein [Pseudoalteromonas mariniglutinosa]|uniref:polysaccharide pyruvyl transferase family protein n=1 Tax=Pseudoalteromonas mariniglutinosa TaxID=206042 RepID=UPI00384F17B4